MVLPTPLWTTSPLTNNAYGFPAGAKRRVVPVALICVHITANPNKPPATAKGERDYANRAGSGGPSAHYYLDRDRLAGVAAVEWHDYAAWSNGDVNKPKTTVPGIQKVLALRTAGFNANEAYWLEVECCGNEANGYPITATQIQMLALLTAEAAVFSGLEISRATVHAHSDLNTVTRASCPTAPANAEELLGEVIIAARGYLQELVVADLRGQITQLATQLADAKEALGVANGLTAAAESEVSHLHEQIAAWQEYRDRVMSHVGSALSQSNDVASEVASALAIDAPA